MKSTIEQIRQHFDGDVERFSQLETGQAAIIDAPLMLDLTAQAAATMTPQAVAVLDIGCGAGNYTLKLLQRLPDLDCTLLDLSRPMLDRAQERVAAATGGQITTIQSDVREAELGTEQFDVILAAAVLHHLREEAEWHKVFQQLYDSLRPGGSLWIADLITHTTPSVQDTMWQRYGEYLVAFKGSDYREQVFAHIEEEDTPRPLLFQIDALRQAGFQDVEVLHKNSCFAAFGARK